MKRLPDDAGQLLEDGDYLGVRTFEQMVLDRFPELRGDPDVAIGVHLCMAALARLTMEAVCAGKSKRATDVFDFVDQVLQQPNVHHDIRDAIKQSYVVPSELMSTVTGQRVWAAAPVSVRRLLDPEHEQ